MARVVVELTNRCNLRCTHCFPERHAATGELPTSVIDALLADGASCGVDHLCFSGGEPTLHKEFPRIVARTAAAGYSFSVVTNGSTFRHVWRLFVSYRERFGGVTFSLDGAREATHDGIRGGGSYRQVMRAAMLCSFKELPFTFNMVLTSANHTEVEEMVELAARLGSRGVRFGHLMFTPDTTARGLDLSPAARREVEARIWAISRQASIAVTIAPGYFSDSPFFPCAPLEMEEFNVDYRGRLTLCCHLSGFSDGGDGDDLIADLHDVDLVEGCKRVRARVATYLADKRDRWNRGQFTETDHFPCWYCVNYLGKIAAHAGYRPPGWASGASNGKRLRVIAAPTASGS